ncbi:hypothetical protein BC834DRAFT_951458 [Gloeopeniophorella convolvens]|nr:hypothetical protein BC834DRAFT_951458 [Gloeopeniophorella convolvens]
MPKQHSLRTLAINTNAQTKRNGSPAPPSPTFSETTNISAVNFGENGPAKIITRSDLKASMQSYETLLNSCSNYQSALLMMSRATAAFADAMESCAGMKGPSYEQGTRLQASAGLHHLMANHWHVLSETLDKNFEKPLRQHLDTYRTIVHASGSYPERSSSYERTLREKSNIIRATEMRNMNRKERNLQSFREALTVLQRQVDDLDQLKARHYEEIIEHEEEVWDVVQGKISLVVRSTLDVFDRFTAKASDPVLEPMLQSIPDPFDSYGQPHAEDQIFSILPPLGSILAPSASPSPLSVTPQAETSDAFATGAVATWAYAGNGALLYADAAASEWADAASPPRSPSPSRRAHPSHRPSSPPGGSARRAESKLRSVLSVIDEARAPGAAPVDDVPAAADDAPAVGGPRSPRDAGASWARFPFGARSRSASQDSTPRGSVSGHDSSTSPSSVPGEASEAGSDTDAGEEGAQGRHSPRTGRTTVPVSS